MTSQENAPENMSTNDANENRKQKEYCLLRAIHEIVFIQQQRINWVENQVN